MASAPMKIEMDREALRALRDLTRAIEKSNDNFSKKLREAGRPIITNVHNAPCDKEHLVPIEDHTLAKIRNVLDDAYPDNEVPGNWAWEIIGRLMGEGILFREKEVESDGEADGDASEQR